MAQVKAFLDKYTEKFISRKFLAWVAVTLAYVGSEALIDAAIAWRHGPKNGG